MQMYSRLVQYQCKMWLACRLGVQHKDYAEWSLLGHGESCIGKIEVNMHEKLVLSMTTMLKT